MRCHAPDNVSPAQNRTNQRSRRARFARRFAVPQMMAAQDPRAMVTERANNRVDPPATSTNVTGFKRIRKVVTLVAGAGNLTINSITSCLPLTNPQIRIVKLSVWGNDTANLGCAFPTSNGGDISVWSDDGVPGQSRAQIHLTPNFAFRSKWFLLGDTSIIAQFTSTLATLSVIVDISLEYRTNVQSCPAFMSSLLDLQCSERLH